jgi:hypothetical protein
MIDLVKLSSKNIDDYVYFFDKVAFSKDPDWAGCFCVWYHWDDILE